MMWQLRLFDPSGEIRFFPLQRPAILGNSANATIPLRDGTISTQAVQIQPIPTLGRDSPFWFRLLKEGTWATLADIQVREGHLPENVPFKIGETKILLERALPALSLPIQPIAKKWLTCTEAGRDVLWTTQKIANTSLPVYLSGETGTGKEILAHLIHAWSERSGAPFVPINCGALSLSLAESELFGHDKGAFTGADRKRPGALLQAHGGTLFLDEVGELNPELQVKLLRFLENGEIRPVGGDHYVHANVRVVCATHKDLSHLVDRGLFRQDLYYRLAPLSLEIPPLRDRPEDIAYLAHQFAKESQRSLSPQAVLRLQAHSWPGNVRELRHAIERAIGVAGAFASLLSEADFEFLLQQKADTSKPELHLGNGAVTLKDMERMMILRALRIANGNRSRAASILGIARSTLFEKIKSFKIVGPRSHFHERRWSFG